MSATERRDVCDCCGQRGEGVAWFAAAYRKSEQRAGRADPGNLCGACAGRRRFVGSSDAS